MKYVALFLLIPAVSFGQQFSLIELTGSPEIVSVDFTTTGICTVLDNKLFFDAYVPSHLPGLWYTDGTAEGTAFLYALITEGQSDPVQLFTYGDRMLICGRDIEHVDTENDLGVELWISDGTTEGTHLLKDIRPGAGFSTPQGFTEMLGEVYFFAYSELGSYPKLWKTNGTEAGTVQVSTADVLAPLIEHNGTLYFRGVDEDTGWELWKSDGTEAGTTMIKDIRVGSPSSAPYNFISFNDKLYFSAHDGYGTQLFVSDGTADGTYRVKDIFPTSVPDPNFRPNVQNLTVHNGLLYFTADDGVHGCELWATDGTEEATVMIKDINPGAAHGLNQYGPGLVSSEDELFFAANDGVHGKELWKSDGTEDGTLMIKDILEGTGTDFQHIVGVIPFNGKIYFSARENPSGNKLFESDGTADGTFSIAPPDATTYEYPMGYGLSSTIFENGLFFTADFYGTGTKLWRYGGEIISAIPGYPEPEQKNITVYPNPANGKLAIRFPHTGKWHVQLYNTQGVLVFSENNHQRALAIVNIESLPSGIYSVVCTENGNEVFTRQLVKQ